MIYDEYQPATRFSQYIECIWVLKGTIDNSGFVQEALVPGGRTEIIFTNSTFLWYGENREAIPDSITGPFLLGARKSANFIGLKDVYNCWGIRFRIGCLSCFTNKSAHSYTNKISPLSAVFDQAIPPPDIFLENNIAETLTSIECWLEQVFTVPDRNWEIVQELIKQYAVDDEKVLVKELSQKYLWSYKKTERMFVKYIGLTPRTVIKLLRFRRLMEAMKSSPGTFTSSAYQFGFFDQSHFIKEFHHFTGSNPGTFYKNPPGIAALLYKI